MEPAKQRHTFWQTLFATSLPRAHLAAAGAVAFSTVILLSLMPSENVEAKRQILALELPGTDATADSAPPGLQQMDSSRGSNDLLAANDKPKVASGTRSAAISNEQPGQHWRPTTLVNGDNLTSAFKRLGLTESDVYAVANASREASRLRNLKPGETIAAALGDQGQLAEVKYSRSRLEHYLYTRDGAGFKGEKVLYQPEIIPTFKQGRIENSLFLDASRTGLSEAKIMELANIFGWDIDFALDIREGDMFSVIYEEQYLQGEKVGNGDILAATFTNQGKTFEAVRFIDADGSVTYYAPDGKPMKKAFLRAPLDFTRISSNFNMRRLHPIHKYIRAHRGVDYAAPRGTPVYAAGEGKVIASGYSRPNGNYVFVQHRQNFITKYLHLDKRTVRQGQIVKQRHVIGTVGSTGYATGPHLHYEFLVNGVHHDPRTVKLPEANPIAANQRPAFIAQSAPLLAKLKQLSAVQVALNTETD